MVGYGNTRIIIKKSYGLGVLNGIVLSLIVFGIASLFGWGLWNVALGGIGLSFAVLLETNRERDVLKRRRMRATVLFFIFVCIVVAFFGFPSDMI